MDQMIGKQRLCRPSIVGRSSIVYLLLAMSWGCEASRPASNAEAAAEATYPAPDAHLPLHGPGGPARVFKADELNKRCALLSGGPGDTTQHHNLVVMFDGYLVMPWAPEHALNGGLALYDVSDPCAPKMIGQQATKKMRETHSIGFSTEGGQWAVVNHGELLAPGHPPISGGIAFWDLSDPTSPKLASTLKFADFLYPDAYAFVVLSVFWQGDYVYVAFADNGIVVVDARDPTQPKVVKTYVFEPILRAGQVQAIGNLLFVGAADQARAVLLDISEPTHPKAISGGDFVVADADGKPRKAYFSSVARGHAWFTRKDSGGGLLVYDIRDPSKPSFAGGHKTNGKGGYVMFKEGKAFCGESNHAVVFDVAEIAEIKELQRLKMVGDLDTATPIGNVVVLSVDDKADLKNGAGSEVHPFELAVDAAGPKVTWAFPADGASDLALTSRFGVTFNEMVEPKTAWKGSVRLYETTLGDAGAVDGIVNAQEHILNFTPRAPLKPQTHYTLELPAGGVADYNGNRMTTTYKATFTTGDG